jgi:hypothetical protein
MTIENIEKERMIKVMTKKALDLAIKALEQQPCESVLDKIRAEIKTMSGDIETIADVLEIIDKYRAESEG